MRCPNHSLFSRRLFLEYAIAGTISGTILGSCCQQRTQPKPIELPPIAPYANGYNILFIFTDQERYFRQWPSGYSLPGHQLLRETGVTFRNHYAPVVMCTSSRVERCREAGYEVVEDEPLEGCDRVFVFDPFGNRHELIEVKS